MTMRKQSRTLTDSPLASITASSSTILQSASSGRISSSLLGMAPISLSVVRKHLFLLALLLLSMAPSEQHTASSRIHPSQEQQHLRRDEQQLYHVSRHPNLRALSSSSSTDSSVATVVFENKRRHDSLLIRRTLSDDVEDLHQLLHRSLVTSSNDFRVVEQELRQRSFFTGQQPCEMVSNGDSASSSSTSNDIQFQCDNISLIFTVGNEVTAEGENTYYQVVRGLQACKSRTIFAANNTMATTIGGNSNNAEDSETTNVCVSIAYETNGQAATCTAQWWNGQFNSGGSSTTLSKLHAALQQVKLSCNSCTICPSDAILVSVDCGATQNADNNFVNSMGDNGPYCMDLGQYLYGILPPPPPVTAADTTDQDVVSAQEVVYPVAPLPKDATFDEMMDQLNLLYSNATNSIVSLSGTNVSCTYKSEQTTDAHQDGIWLVERIWSCTKLGQDSGDGGDDLIIKLSGFQRQSVNVTLSTGQYNEDAPIVLDSFEACRQSSPDSSSSTTCVSVEYSSSQQQDDTQDDITLQTSTANSCVANTTFATVMASASAETNNNVGFCNSCTICTIADTGEFGFQMNCDNVRSSVSTANGGTDCQPALSWLEQTASVESADETTDATGDGSVSEEPPVVYPVAPLPTVTTFQQMQDQFNLLYSNATSSLVTLNGVTVSCTYNQGTETLMNGVWIIQRSWTCSNEIDGGDDLTIQLTGFQQQNNDASVEEPIILTSFQACRESDESDNSSSTTCVQVEYLQQQQSDDISLQLSTASTCAANSTTDTTAGVVCNRCTICTLGDTTGGGEFGFQMNCDNVRSTLSTANGGTDCQPALSWLEQTAVQQQVSAEDTMTAETNVPTTIANVVPTPTYAPFTCSPVTSAPLPAPTPAENTTSTDTPEEDDNAGSVLTLPPLMPSNKTQQTPVVNGTVKANEVPKKTTNDTKKNDSKVDGEKEQITTDTSQLSSATAAASSSSMTFPSNTRATAATAVSSLTLILLILL